jgi:hypothetical protein
MTQKVSGPFPAEMEELTGDNAALQAMKLKAAANDAQSERLAFAFRQGWDAARIEKDGGVYWRLRRGAERAIITPQGSVITL